MRKKTIIISSIIALSVLLIVGTMAWFSDTKVATNLFTAGTVEIEVNEHGFEDLDNINPGDEKTKNVSVKSIGTKRSYVRVALIPQWNPINLSTDVVILNTNEDDWVYENGWYYYKYILEQGEETSLLLESVTFASDIGNEYQGATFTITVKAEAVQASHEAYKDVWGIDSLPTGVEILTPTP
ncbi:TasA family protein [Clostridium sp. Cult2]|uniref:TasA family protein n=1 Tax=Clostridium sp. Cult2 TaxID=2079003 RepID=UPI001F2E524A|nr:TasA family protein [Clostridium sp. Cult2]MCF6465841.1 hypothetical protein [Clostridium sp. Cult2]